MCSIDDLISKYKQHQIIAITGDCCGELKAALIGGGFSVTLLKDNQQKSFIIVDRLNQNNLTEVINKLKRHFNFDVIDVNDVSGNIVTFDDTRLNYHSAHNQFYKCVFNQLTNEDS